MMFPFLLSTGEKKFVLDGIESDTRCDGRSRKDYRPMEVETDVVPQTNGSARLRLANTDILVGVKIEVSEPIADSPNKGRIDFFVDCSANATPAFEGRGGEDLAVELCSALSKAYSYYPLEGLCIVQGKKCWKIYVDVLILECGGNLYDAVSLAVKAALRSTQIPKVVAVYNDGTNVDIEFSDDLADSQKFDLSFAPCFVTLCKVGNHLVTDVTMGEELCGIGSIVIAVTASGKITAIVKTGEGSFHPNTINEAIKLSTEIGKSLNKALEEALMAEDELGPSRKRSGFLE